MLIGKTAQLQLFSDKYRDRGSSTAIDQQVIYPGRGLIYDRNEKLLVNNFQIYNLNAVYNQLDPDMDTTLFCELLEITKDEFLEYLNKDWRKASFNKSTPFTFLSKIKPEIFARFQEHLFRFPGFTPMIRSVRAYPHTNAAHVLGYLGEADSSKINKSNGLYDIGDFIGQNGLERYYDIDLRGKKGIRFVMKDNLGREVGSYNDGLLDSLAVTGKDLYTTIDLDLQKLGEELMQNKRGSIVAIEPKTGEILACLSAPGYDPNLLNLDRGRGKAYNALRYDSINIINKPLINRSVVSKYPPGSIFKPILSLIALQEKTTYAGRTLQCDGSYVINKRKGFSQGCHNHPTPTNISTAIQHSCNSYYYQLVKEVIEKEGYNNPGKGLQILVDYLKEFGLGQKLGIDYSHESTGFIPTPEHYDQQYNYVRSGWRASYILSLGIGQGELQLTTMQMANLAVILANRGYYYTPHFVKPETASFDPKFNIKNKVSIDPQHFDPVLYGMQKVITSGTAQAGRIPGISSAGKTGTSQNPQGKDHSVYFAFAPIDDPQIAIAVYVENAGFGGDIAAPIASLLLEKYIKSEIPEYRLPLLNRMKELDLISNP